MTDDGESYACSEATRVVVEDDAGNSVAGVGLTLRGACSDALHKAKESGMDLAAVLKKIGEIIKAETVQ